jgi:hypothetical protein
LLCLPRASCRTSLGGSEGLSAAAQLSFSREGERGWGGGGGGGGLWVFGLACRGVACLGRLSDGPWGGVGEEKEEEEARQTGRPQASRAVRLHMGRTGFLLETNQPAHTAHLHLSLCSLLLLPPPPPESLFCSVGFTIIDEGTSKQLVWSQAAPPSSSLSPPSTAGTPGDPPAPA